MARENLWLVKCTDRDGDDVDGLREEYMAGHLSHIEAIVDHIAMAGPLKDPAGDKIVGSMLVYRTDDLEQAKAWLDGDPYARCGIWGNDRVVPSGVGGRYPSRWCDLVVPLSATLYERRCPSQPVLSAQSSAWCGLATNVSHSLRESILWPATR